jgi:DNA-binding transcriptional MerR regulator
MAEHEQEPGRYRIQTVAKITGVAAATLRAWERRYGIPRPGRSKSSYRLYSDDDVAKIVRMRDLCEQGMSPSAAGEVVSAASEPEQALPVETLGAADRFCLHNKRLVEAIANSDVEQLRVLCQMAMLLGSAAEILEHVVVPTQREVGDRWHAGTLAVAQEHMGSEMLGRIARDLLRLMQPLDVVHGNVILACPAWETHSLPLYIVGARMAQWGFQTWVLGPSIPAKDLAMVIDAKRPTMVGLSMSTNPPADIDERLEAYSAALGDTPWLLGGRAVRRVAKKAADLGAHLAFGSPLSVRSLMLSLADREIAA